MSFGLQLAVNAEATREFVLSSSEVITRFMVKYQRYEDEFRCPEAGEDFDHLLTNAYKAILLYVINLDKYLGQSEPGLCSLMRMHAGCDKTNFNCSRAIRTCN